MKQFPIAQPPPSAQSRKATYTNDLRLQMLELAVSHLTTTCNSLREDIRSLRSTSSSNHHHHHQGGGGTTVVNSAIFREAEDAVIPYYISNSSSELSKDGAPLLAEPRRRRSWTHPQKPVEIHHGSSKKKDGMASHPAAADKGPDKRMLAAAAAAGAQPKEKSFMKANSKAPPSKPTKSALTFLHQSRSEATAHKVGSFKPSKPISTNVQPTTTTKPKAISTMKALKLKPSKNVHKSTTVTVTGAPIIAKSSSHKALEKITTTRPAATESFGSSSSKQEGPNKKAIKTSQRTRVVAKGHWVSSRPVEGKKIRPAPTAPQSSSAAFTAKFAP